MNPVTQFIREKINTAYKNNTFENSVIELNSSAET